MKSASVTAFILLVSLFCFSCLKEEIKPSETAKKWLFANDKNGNPFTGEVIILDDEKEVMRLDCAPENAVFDSFNGIEYGYEISLKNGSYRFQMKAKNESQEQVLKVAGNINLNWR